MGQSETLILVMLWNPIIEAKATAQQSSTVLQKNESERIEQFIVCTHFQTNDVTLRRLILFRGQKVLTENWQDIEHNIN